MWRHRFLVLTYVYSVLTTNLYVEAVARPTEYLSEVKQNTVKRLRRSAINFHQAIRCYQPSVNILGTYGDYGCYCGVNGNRGYAAKALDETDECCKQHDSCYDEAVKVEKTMWESLWLVGQPLLKSYNVDCLNDEVVCGKNSPYQDKICSCDKEAAKCFHAASVRYRPQLFNIDVNKYCEKDSKTDGLNLTYYENRYPQREQMATTVQTPVKEERALLNSTKESTNENSTKQVNQQKTKDEDVAYMQVNFTTAFEEIKQEENSFKLKENKNRNETNKSYSRTSKPEQQPLTKSIATSPKVSKNATSGNVNNPLKRPALRTVLKTKRMPAAEEQERTGRLREHPKRPDTKRVVNQQSFANKNPNDPSGCAEITRNNLYYMLHATLYAILFNFYAM
uniref:Phospholipase A2 n=1 Tax=Phallusia mammillata TaxID=59560 RepID=A0A6F9DP58_9ASCI|nr:acidic phospholipase A2 57 [Phallusia mammillata]